MLKKSVCHEMGLVKNQYVARTFIQPTQELREQGVRVKLSAVKDIVDGKILFLLMIPLFEVRQFDVL